MRDGSSDLLLELASRRKAFRAGIESRACSASKGFQPSPPLPQEIVKTPERDLTIGAGHLQKAEAEIDAKREAMPPRPETLAMIADGLKIKPKVKSIIHIVAEHYNVSGADILSSRRFAHVVRPRQIAMYLSRVLTLRSLPEIARRFGRDHTTMIHAGRKIEAMVAADPIFRERVEFIAADIISRMMRAK